MTPEQFRSEAIYQIAIYKLKMLFDEGMIDKARFEEKNRELIEKYNPIYITLEAENEDHNTDTGVVTHRG